MGTSAEVACCTAHAGIGPTCMLKLHSCSEVFKCQHKVTKDIVALKKLRPDVEKNGVRMIRRHSR
jgi:hypothetical protein